MLGHPIGHSLSPVMHRAAYAHLGLDWEYDAHDVPAAGLPEFVASCGPRWRGLSLTMPLKRAVLPLLDERSELVKRVGAANTAVFEAGALHGDNTDVAGVTGALGEAGIDTVATAVLVGAGATADSVRVALEDLRLRRLHVAVRDPDRARSLARHAQAAGVQVTVGALADLAHRTGMAAVPDAVDLLVSTVPGGLDIGPETSPGDELLSRSRAVLDVAYDPWPSPLLTRARGHGAQVVDGIAMLAHQAARQVRLMTEQEVPVDVLRVAAWSALESRR
ncbi:MAG: shikimate dehydrogenase [Actinomycetota bacterium]|nr:shikimate dehydrogenase [Actinomycetota bacterium]